MRVEKPKQRGKSSRTGQREERGRIGEREAGGGRGRERRRGNREQGEGKHTHRDDVELLGFIPFRRLPLGVGHYKEIVVASTTQQRGRRIIHKEAWGNRAPRGRGKGGGGEDTEDRWVRGSGS
jgi:hypothetical protein